MTTLLEGKDKLTGCYGGFPTHGATTKFYDAKATLFPLSSPFRKQINDKHTKQKPMPSISQYKTDMFKTDALGFTNNHAQYISNSPFEKQLTSDKSYYDFNPERIPLDTMMELMSEYDNQKQAINSKELYNALLYIPRIFEKLSKYQNDLLSNPTLTMDKYLNSGELTYLKHLNVNNLSELKPYLEDIRKYLGLNSNPVPPVSNPPVNMTVTPPNEVETASEDEEEIETRPPIRATPIKKPVEIAVINPMKGTDIKRHSIPHYIDKNSKTELGLKHQKDIIPYITNVLKIAIVSPRGKQLQKITLERYLGNGGHLEYDEGKGAYVIFQNI